MKFDRVDRERRERDLNFRPVMLSHPGITSTSGSQKREPPEDQASLPEPNHGPPGNPSVREGSE